MPPIVHNDDVDHRLLETARSFQEQVAALIATQDYPFPVTGACASDDNNQGLSGFPNGILNHFTLMQ